MKQTKALKQLDIDEAKAFEHLKGVLANDIIKVKKYEQQLQELKDEYFSQGTPRQRLEVLERKIKTAEYELSEAKKDLRFRTNQNLTEFNQIEDRYWREYYDEIISQTEKYIDESNDYTDKAMEALRKRDQEISEVLRHINSVMGKYRSELRLDPGIHRHFGNEGIKALKRAKEINHQ